MKKSTIIWIVLYVGPEWSQCVVAMTDKREAEAKAKRMNDKLDNGTLDRKQYLFQTLSNFKVEQLNLVEYT